MGSIKNFYDNLKKQVDKATQSIEETKKFLTAEITRIGELEAQTETTKSFVGLGHSETLRVVITPAVRDLITKCKAYSKRHKSNTLPSENL